MEPDESIARSIGTSGSAVVFAGCTVIIALLCLYFSGIPLVRSLGYTTAMVVATAVLAAITFLPAVLGLLGRRILKPAVPAGRAQARLRTTRAAGSSGPARSAITPWSLP